jgi:hypothetical protein
MNEWDGKNFPAGFFAWFDLINLVFGLLRNYKFLADEGIAGASELRNCDILTTSILLRINDLSWG